MAATGTPANSPRDVRRSETFHQLSRSRRVSRTAGVGHEDALPPPRLSAGYRLRKPTFSGTQGNGQDAPNPGWACCTGGRGWPATPLARAAANRRCANNNSCWLQRGRSNCNRNLRGIIYLTAFCQEASRFCDRRRDGILTEARRQFSQFGPRRAHCRPT